MATMSSRLVQPLVDSNRNVIREAWDRLHRIPGGKAIFTKMIGMAAPYTGTIPATVLELRETHCRVRMLDRRSVRNHLRCVHAIALANLAELTGNVALSYALPDDGRFIVAGMSLDYVKKARGTIVATCECPRIESSAEREFEVPVVLRDESGEVVVRATLRSKVGPKRGVRSAKPRAGTPRSTNGRR